MFRTRISSLIASILSSLLQCLQCLQCLPRVTFTIFLSKPKSDKVLHQTKQTKQTNSELGLLEVPSESISEPNYTSTKSEGQVLNIFLNDPLDEPKKIPSSKKFYLFRKMVKNAGW